jgi:uncharacterized membrane protein YcaP (DUF421 family)
MTDFQLSDWHRILFGGGAWPILVEVLIRTVLTFFLLIGAMRLLGRRVAAQFTLFEIAVVVTLAAAVGVPLQATNRGMLPPLIIVVVVILLQRAVMHFGVRHRRIETAIATDVSVLIRDGRISLDTMRAAALGQDQVFALLRIAGLQHLGQVSRAYMEPSGKLTIVRAGARRPGLSVLPDFERALRDEAQSPGCYACSECGHTTDAQTAPRAPCAHCGAHAWVGAVGELKD